MTILRSEPWKAPSPSRVKLIAPAFVRYAHVDIEKNHSFMLDFGMQVAGRTADKIFYTGYGIQPVLYVAEKCADSPHLVGIFFEAASFEDMEKATKVPGAGPMEDLDTPGGGKVVCITDPNGQPFGVVWGSQKKDFNPPPTHALAMNHPARTDEDTVAKPRRGQSQRVPFGPVACHKLGHTGLWSPNLETTMAFYLTHFNFKPSDVMLSEESLDSAPSQTFFHIDLGRNYSDHHALILGQADNSHPPGPHHSSFEVENIDKTFVAHDYLKSKEYTHFWGIGRHTEGSQVFDYWFNVDGFLVEHYTDGDIVNEDNVLNWRPKRPKYNVWGPEIPKLPPPPAT